MKPTQSAIQQCARQTELLFDLFLNLDAETALRRKKDVNEKNEGIRTLSLYFLIDINSQSKFWFIFVFIEHYTGYELTFLECARFTFFAITLKSG